MFAYLPGQIDKTYISSITFLDQREILKDVLNIRDEEATILDMLEDTGRSVVTGVPTYDHFTDDWLYASAVVESSSGGGTGAATTVVLEEASHTGTEIHPKVTELVMNEAGVVGFISATGGSSTDKTITINPVDNTQDFETGGDLSTQYLIFFSNAQTEGSSSPSGRKSNLIKSQNQIQIFKEKFSITDLQKVSKIEVEFNGKPYFMAKGQHDAFLKFRMDIMFALLLGRKSVGLTYNSKTVYTTSGLEQEIVARGINFPLTAAIDRDDFKSIDRQLNLELAPDDYWLWAGTDINQDLDDLFRIETAGPMQQGGINYNSFGKGNGKQKALDMGVDSFRVYGRTYHKKKLPALDHKFVTAATNFKYTEMAFLIPTKQQKVELGGGMVDRIRTRFMAGDGVNLRYKEWNTGGLAPVPTDDVSEWNINYESIQGLELIGAEHAVRIYDNS